MGFRFMTSISASMFFKTRMRTCSQSKIIFFKMIITNTSICHFVPRVSGCNNQFQTVDVHRAYVSGTTDENNTIPRWTAYGHGRQCVIRLPPNTVHAHVVYQNDLQHRSQGAKAALYQRLFAQLVGRQGVARYRSARIIGDVNTLAIVSLELGQPDREHVAISNSGQPATAVTGSSCTRRYLSSKFKSGLARVNMSYA